MRVSASDRLLAAGGEDPAAPPADARAAVRPLRVLHLHARSDWGGTLEHMALLCRHGPALGQRAMIAMSTDQPAVARLRARGCEVYDFTITNKWDWRAARRLAALCRRLRVDVLHSHIRAVDPAVVRVRGVCRVPLIVTTLHDRPGLAPDGRRERGLAVRVYYHLLRRRFDHVITVSAATRRAVRDAAHLRPAQVTHLVNGIALDRLTPTRDRAAMRTLLGVPAGVPLIGALGRWSEPKKGLLVWLAALGELRARGRDFRAVLVGDGEARPAIRERRRALGLEDRVCLAAFTDRPADYYHALDLFCLPSRWEGMPRALMEAMACGVPAVACPCDGVEELLGAGGERGLRARADDPADLARAIEAALADPAAAVRRAAAARTLIRTRYRADLMARATDRLYRRLLGRKVTVHHGAELP